MLFEQQKSKHQQELIRLQSEMNASESKLLQTERELEGWCLV